jgi:dTDP-4-dehydrorhamnose 3,5-epimerase
LQRIETSLPGVFELRPTIFRDSRGFFMETYNRAKFAEIGINDSFVQDNHSLSRKGTLRGFHYQLHRPQAKLCRVVEGEAFDVALDIRRGSPTFGQWAGLILSAREHNQLYIPTGFAHSFLALTESVQLLYKCSDLYDPADERGILWNDPAIHVPWEITSPLVSEKDQKFPTLAGVLPKDLPRYSGKC